MNCSQFVHLPIFRQRHLTIRTQLPTLFIRLHCGYPLALVWSSKRTMMNTKDPARGKPLTCTTTGTWWFRQETILHALTTHWILGIQLYISHLSLLLHVLLLYSWQVRKPGKKIGLNMTEIKLKIDIENERKRESGEMWEGRGGYWWWWQKRDIYRNGSGEIKG